MSSNLDFVIENGVLKEYSGPGGDVVIPAGVTEIGGSAFAGYTDLTGVIIPESVKKIGWYAFQGCTGLIRVTIPAGVTEIDGAAFEGCTGLTNVTIPESVTEIEEFAFSDCTGLTGVTIPAGVTTIGRSAFKGCTGLTSVTIPESVTEIDDRTFSGCTGLTSVTILAGVTKIGRFAFSDCTGLESITILGRPEISKETFPDSVTVIVAEQLRMSDYPAPAYKQMAARGFALRYGSGEVLPEDYRADCLKYIRGQKKKFYPMALQDPALLHVMLAEQIIPKGDLPDLIDRAAAAGSAEVTAMLLDYQDKQLKPGERQKLEEQKMQREIEFMLTGTLTAAEAKKSWRYEKNENGNLIILGYKGGKTEVEVPTVIGKDSVTEIGCFAFSGYTGLTSVTIPAGVTEIGSSAFWDCTGLTSVTIPDSVTKIDGYAFKDCTGLTSVTIPASVTEIDDGTFSGCTGLTSVTIPTSVTEIGDRTFFGCTGLTSVTIPARVKKIGWYAFFGCTGLTSVTIPARVKKIGKSAFEKCKNLTIHAPAGSYAEEYAKKNNIRFIAE